MTTTENLMFDPDERRKFIEDCVKRGTITREQADKLNKDLDKLFDIFDSNTVNSGDYK